MKLIVVFIFCLSIFYTNITNISASTENIQYGALIRVCENENETGVTSWVTNHYVKKDLPPNETNQDLASFCMYNLTEASPITTFFTFLEDITVQIELKYFWASGFIANKDSLEKLQEAFHITDNSEAVVFELVHVEEDNAIREYVRVFATSCKATGIEKPNYIDIPKCGKKCAVQIFIALFRNMIDSIQKTEEQSSILTWMTFGIIYLYFITTVILFLIAYMMWKLYNFVFNYFERQHLAPFKSFYYIV